MEKITESMRKNALLHFKEDIIENDEFKFKLKSINNKFRKMLLWSTICSVCSYLILIITIVSIYSNFKGLHPTWLISSMLGIYLLMGILIYFVWKGSNYKKTYFYYASKTYLRYQLINLAAQRKLISLYLLEYVLLLCVAGVFFFVDIKDGLNCLLKITAPVSIVTYVLGIYFIFNFTKQMNNLKMAHSQINQLYVKNINSN